MDLFRKKYRNQVVFVLSSDDLRWSGNMFRNARDVAFAARAEQRTREGVDSVPFDMAVLSKCNHSIVR